MQKPNDQRRPAQREPAQPYHWHDRRSPNTGPIALIAAASADSAAHPGDQPRQFSWPWFRQLFSQLLKFGLVGGTGVIVDFGVFNLLRSTVLSPDDWRWGPLWATIIATIVAILWNWVGNRLWTFREQRRDDGATREAVEFFLVSLAGMVIGLIPLWISHYLLGMTSVAADNIAKFIGIGVGSVFRFLLYRWWVYAPHRVS